MTDFMEEFLTNQLVIEIDSFGDILIILKRLKAAGLTKVRYFWRAIKGGTDIDWMTRKYPYGELCLEYQIGKGLTISGKQENLNWGNRVVTVHEFMKETEISSYREWKDIPVCQEADRLPHRHPNGYILVVRKNGEEKPLRFIGASFVVTKDESHATIFKTRSAVRKKLEALMYYQILDSYIDMHIKFL